MPESTEPRRLGATGVEVRPAVSREQADKNVRSRARSFI
jgi:hypothetical protein